MEKRPTMDYIWLGALLRFLQDVQPGAPIKGEQYVLSNLKTLHEALERAGLPVSMRAAATARVDRIIEEMEAIEDDDATLTVEQRTKLNAAMGQMWSIVDAEASGVYAFIVSDKRLDTTKLLDAPEQLFAPGVFADLTDHAQEDFRRAARCIAFEQPTAAAFHLMRATEAELRELYRTWVKRERLKEPWMWAAMINHLRKRRAGPPTVLLDHLDRIRINFRNPTQHPDAVYDIHEAQDLCSVCVDALNRSVRARRTSS